MIKSKKIELVNPKELVFHPKNMNHHPKEQIARLIRIIEYQGFRVPIIVQKGTNLVVSGNGRLEAAIKMNLESVPVIYQEFESDAQLYAFMVSDNAIASWSDLDLEEINKEILEFEDFDLELLGIEDFKAIEPEVIPLCDEDDVPDVVEPITKRGDIWMLGNHRLMCGDSTMIDDVERLMGGERADMVFTDPPYGVDYEGIKNDSRDGLKSLLDNAFSNYSIFSNAGAPIYCFHSDRCADIFHEIFRKYCHFSSMIIWVKPSLVLSQTDYQSRHEPCMYGWIEGGPHSWNSDRKQTSVWEFGKESINGHTTPKPVDLICYAIKNSSKEKSIVVDFFGGSGSTLMACEKTSRKARLIELDEKYCDVIINRWQNFTGEKAVLESNGKTYDELKNG